MGALQIFFWEPLPIAVIIKLEPDEEVPEPVILVIFTSPIRGCDFFFTGTRILTVLVTSALENF
jgi:hypothetical protein